MANVIKEGGLRLKVARVDQASIDCVHLAADSVPLGIGDAVKSSSSGVGTLANGRVLKAVARVAAGDPIFGVVVDCDQVSVSSGFTLERRHCPASTLMLVRVRPARHDDIYAITEDGTTALTNINNGANLTGNGGGTTITDCDSVTGLSTMLLDTSTEDASTATLQLKLQGFEATADNVSNSVNSSILVTLNNIELGGGTGTVGV